MHGKLCPTANRPLLLHALLPLFVPPSRHSKIQRLGMRLFAGVSLLVLATILPINLTGGQARTRERLESSSWAAPTPAAAAGHPLQLSLVLPSCPPECRSTG